MKCQVCKIGTMYLDYIRVLLSSRFGASFIFKHVPAQICRNCGEEFIRPSTMEQFLEVIGLADNAHLGLRRLKGMIRKTAKKGCKTKI
jgi:YgiT-type zinc finger domain-containing protein